MFKRRVILFIFSLICWTAFSQQGEIDLAGEWQFVDDRKDQYLIDNNFSGNFGSETIYLPGTTDQAGKGTAHISGEPLYDGKPEIHRLARKNVYIGPAWYSRTFQLPADWLHSDQYRLIFKMDRVMWKSSVWINGKSVGSSQNLVTPHLYDLSSFLNSGENQIIMRIDNSAQVHLGSWSHGYSEEVQTIWNGAIGNISIKREMKRAIKNVQVYTTDSNQWLNISFQGIELPKDGMIDLLITEIEDGTKKLQESQPISIQDSKYNLRIPINKNLSYWSDETPILYNFEITFRDKNGNKTKRRWKSGIRSFTAENGDFYLNGNKTFLRGEHSAAYFPLTGYPSMKKEDWIRIFRIGKECGLNHWRFHSCSPSEAAFDAADEVGILLQPELSLFSQNWEGTTMGSDQKRDDFLFQQLENILNEFGSHPSFALFSMGNELKGDPAVLIRWVNWAKENYPGKLYASNSNLEAMRLYNPLDGDDFQVAHAYRFNGRRGARRMKDLFNIEVPNTFNDYSDSVRPEVANWPVISHEVGQWLVYPDFDEIQKYTGILQPRNLEIFKERLTNKGMINQAKDFHRATASFSQILYKEEMEKLIRTPGMDGYQLLDLQDFPGQGSAHIGLFDSFWAPKVGISTESIAQSASAITVLAKMKKRVWVNDEKFTAEVVIPNYSTSAVSGGIEWSLLAGDVILKKGLLEPGIAEQGEVTSKGVISFSLSDFDKPLFCQLKLKTRITSDHEVTNSYDLWVYPKRNELNRDIIITRMITPSIKRKLRRGAKVLYMPTRIEDSEKMVFTPPFWSTLLFDYQPKTMGILCDPLHPVFKQFPTQIHSNWQWWELTRDVKAFRENEMPTSYVPLIQVIDHPVRNDRLSLLSELSVGNGKIIISAIDLKSDLKNRPAARQLRNSIINYMRSDAFNPQTNSVLEKRWMNSVSVAGLKYKALKIYDPSGNELSKEGATAVFDGAQTKWTHTGSVRMEISLTDPVTLKGCTLISGLSSKKPGEFTIFVTDNLEEKGDPVISGDFSIADNHEAVMWDNGFTFQQGKKGQFIIIEIAPGKGQKQEFQIEELQFDLE